MTDVVPDLATAGQGLRVDLLAADLLSAVVAHFAASDRPLPERRYVSGGEPTAVAWDCEQLTVTIQGIGWGVAEESYPVTMQANNSRGLAQRHVVYDVELVRCTPDTSTIRDGVPDMDTLNAWGLGILRDMGLLSQATVAFGNTLRSKGAVVRPGIVNPAGPSGGFVGAVCQFYVSSFDLS
jgi:hypothetical protein